MRAQPRPRRLPGPFDYKPHHSALRHAGGPPAIAGTPIMVVMVVFSSVGVQVHTSTHLKKKV
jgi:hypothetical protein